MKSKIILVITLIAGINGYGQTFEQGKKEFQNENYYIAKQTLLKVYSLQKSKDEQVPFYIANAYLKLEDADSANYYYNQISEGNSALAYIAKAKLALNNNDQTKADELISKAITKSGKNSAEINFQAGYAYLEPTPVNLDKAINYLKTAVTEQYNNVLYHFTLGDAYVLNKDYGNALNRYESAVEIAPNSAIARLKLGRLSFKTNLTDNAIKAYEKAIELDPTLVVAYRELGQIHYYLKDKDKAIINFSKYIQLSPGDKGTQISYATFLYGIKEYQLAADFTSGFLKKDSLSFPMYRVLGYSEYELKNYEKAGSAMKNFWKYSNGKKVTKYDYSYSARIAIALNDTASAFDYYRKAVANDSINGGEMQTEYAKALYTARNYPGAIEAYKKRMTMMPKSNDLDVYYLGTSYYYNQDYVNADSTFALFMRNQPSSADGYYWRGEINSKYESGSTIKGYAAPYFEKYIELTSADATKAAFKPRLVKAYLYLAYYKSSIKENDKSKEYLAKVLELEPENEVAKALKTQLK